MATSNIDVLKAQIIINQKTIDELNNELKKAQETLDQQQRDDDERKLLSEVMNLISKIKNCDHLHTINTYAGSQLVAAYKDQLTTLKK